jgi:hypothetical protein
MQKTNAEYIWNLYAMLYSPTASSSKPYGHFYTVIF